VYYGIHDGLDLREVPWRRGHGYDVESLGNVMTGNDVWARHVLQSLHEHLDDASSMRALGFCVSVDHARFMARFFSEHGIESRGVGRQPGRARVRMRSKPARGFRPGGVLRGPVQRGRRRAGRRHAAAAAPHREPDAVPAAARARPASLPRNKAVCTVLDFVGIHRAEFRFDLKLRALLGGTRRELETQVAQGFPYLPAGCHMQLDRCRATWS
jgi:hypothetical protein